MRALVQEKERAVYLRKKGYSYREILIQVPVAKSSLSLWLSDLPLNRYERVVLKKRKNGNISRGRIRSAYALRQRRLEREARWLQEARESFEKNKHEPLFNIGISLYWAEGGKRVNQWGFSNSDKDMVRIVVKWLEIYPLIKKSELFFRLYMHKLYAHECCENWWAKQLGVALPQFLKTIYKPTGLGIKKRPQYRGCLKIEVRKSKGLLCKMKFWQNMLVEQHLKKDINLRAPRPQARFLDTALAEN